ncbi:AT hook motif DNA-binding family protein [Striga asiatica]|uniref:AT-hook motif nuclear-localized protein n=1 Tax=Striga asiatica TaxID=4170 RepID=A0A5A7QGX2_STRAF|nr:AT hook motif DNA-binding family protein [Striga asiatica]
MDGREGMTAQSSSSYYLNNRDGLGGLGPGPRPGARGPGVGLHAPQPVYANLSSHPNIALRPDAGITGNAVGGSSAFHVENSFHNNNNNNNNNNSDDNNNYTREMGIGVVASGGSHGGIETVKKKRGRPRKYGPEGPPPKVSLKLSSHIPKMPSSFDPNTLGEKARRGRPPGTGWKQKLAPLGDWMNSSAGQAFTPHVLHIGIGEDISAKILAFAQQRSRALCIMSGSGSVSVVTLKQPANPSSTVTFESGGPHSRTGGISISVCNPDGHMLGGSIGGRLIAANNVQVVGCSFVYDATKAKTKPESRITNERKLLEQSSEEAYTPYSAAASSQNPNFGPSAWQLSSRQDIKRSQEDIDLTRG